MANKKRLVVIDGKSVFYRGYYAMPNLSTKDGSPTGGVYGFAVMAIEVLKKMKPDYVAVAWDKPKTNIKRRLEIYPEYKGNRKPAPPDFYEQIPTLHNLLEAFGFPFYEIDNHEADDIMATFAAQADGRGYETILVSSDHDLLQLVSDTVTIATMRKGLTNVEMFTPDAFADRYHMTPDQFVDYKSLRGDPSDNIPGVAGVGEKTATQLITDFESLDGIYEHIDEVKGAVQKKLIADKDMAYLTKKLVVLEKEVPLAMDWVQADVTNTNPKEIRQILRDLEFRTLLRQLPADMQLDDDDQADAEAASDFKVTAEVVHVTTLEQLKQLTISTKTLIMHTYTAGAVNTDLQAVLLSPDAKKVYAFDLTGAIKPSDFVQAFEGILSDKDVAKVGYNIKASLKALHQLGVQIEHVGHDLRMGAFLINSLTREQLLTSLAQNELGYEGESLDDLSPYDCLQRAADIASVMWSLYDQQLVDLEKLPKVASLAKEVEWPVTEVLARMEIEGIGLDTSYLNEMSDRLADKISDVEQSVFGFANKEFNVSSPSQLADILFNDLKLPTQGVKKTKTGYSTAASELDKLRGKHEIIDLITQYREYTKLKSTYVDTLPEMVDENSRLHTTFSLSVAPTGRLSSHDPNLQNIPVRSELGREIRTAFVAKPEHVFISADYSQFELRLAAVLAGDDELIEAFNDGLDIHTRTAAQVYGVALEDVSKSQRRDAKVINFGILYGMSPHGLSVATGMDPAEAKEFIDRYFALRKPLLDYIEATRKQAVEEGYVETMFGRRRPTPDTKSSNFVVREAALRAAVNMPIQGTEADLMKMAMIEVDKQVDSDCKQILQIHDSIMLEVPSAKADKTAELLKDIMENVYKLSVVLSVDTSTGINWGELST